MIGQVLRNYKILEKIGEGGMGSVYKAQHLSLNRLVAIKSLNQSIANDFEIVQRFRNEAKILSQLQHPNIVTLYDYVEDPSGYFLIMEYFEGITLGNYIKNVVKVLPETHAILFFEQLLSAFAYAHAQNVIHRDIKPDNILINSKQKIKILDFGIAKIKESNLKTRTGVKMGTITYMSPEQIQATTIDHRTDIYSLGVVLWEMVTGKPPYNVNNQTHFEISNDIVNKPLPNPNLFNSKLSNKVYQIIQKCTAKNPDNRYQNCEQIRLDTLLYYPELFQKSTPNKKIVHNETFIIGEKPFPWKTVIAVFLVLTFSIGAYFLFFFQTFTEEDVKNRVIAFYDKMNQNDSTFIDWVENPLKKNFLLEKIPKGINKVDTSRLVVKKIEGGYKVNFERTFQTEKENIKKRTTFYLRENNLNLYHFFSEDIKNNQNKVSTNHSIEVEIEEFIRNFYTYADNQNTEKLVACYDDKVEKWFLENQPVNKEYILKQSKNYIQTVQNEITDIYEIQITPLKKDHYEVRFHIDYSYELKSKGLKRKKRKGLTGEVLMKLRKKGEEWKIYHLELINKKEY